KEQELNAARAKHRRVERLSKSSPDIAGYADDTRAAQAVANAVKEAVDVEKAKLRALESDDPQAAVGLADSDVEAKKAQLAEAENALKDCTVTAPGRGIILRVLTSE